MAKAGTDNFDIEVIANFDGYVSSKDKTNTAKNVLVEGSQNVYKPISGRVAVRPGLKRWGLPDAATQGIASSYEWYTSLGGIFPFRVVEASNAGNDGKLQVESQIADGETPIWYDLMTGLSKTRFIFDKWWDDTQKKDRAVFVNGTSNIFHWSGGLAKALSGTTNTLTIEGDKTWAQMGFTTTSETPVGASTTQFDITNPSGDTFRYTFDGTGTDPNINATTAPVGSYVFVGAENFDPANNGLFVVTGSGANYFEVENASGVVESNKTIGTGYLYLKYQKVLNIGGNLYGYTGGENTDTLTGIAPNLPIIASGEIVLQPVVTEVNTPAEGYNNDFVKTIGNQLHIGSYTSRLVYISSSTDFRDYNVPSPRTAGSPELLTLDNNANGISVRQGNAHISAGLSDWYVVSYEDIAVSSIITQQTIVDKQETAALSAALAHEFIDTVGDDIVYLSQDNQLRIYGIFRNITTAKYPSLSQAIKTELENVDFAGGHVRSIGDRVYITSPLTGKTYIHESRETVDQAGNIIAERFWHPPQIWNVARIALINGVEYGHSNENPQIYELWNTGQWHDDSPTDTPVPYDCCMSMSYRQHERRQGKLDFDKVYIEGYLLQGSEFYLRINKDYLDPTPQVNTINAIAQPADLYPSNNPEVIGGSIIGDTGIGGEPVPQGYFPKFRIISESTVSGVFEYQLEVFSNTADSAWEILAIGANPTQSTQSAIEIRRG